MSILLELSLRIGYWCLSDVTVVCVLCESPRYIFVKPFRPCKKCAKTQVMLNFLVDTRIWVMFEAFTKNLPQLEANLLDSKVAPFLQTGVRDKMHPPGYVSRNGIFSNHSSVHGDPLHTSKTVHTGL